MALSLLAVVGSAAFLALTTQAVTPLADRLRGRVLLQVESRGEAWWVNPATRQRFFLGRPADALEVLRRQGIGITDADLARIPVGITDLKSQDQDGDGLHDALEDAIGTNRSAKDTDDNGFFDKTELLAGQNPAGPGILPLDSAFAAGQSGRILLQVEARGEAWWVNPTDLKRYYLGRPAEMLDLMRLFGLGIANADLRSIDEGLPPTVAADAPPPLQPLPQPPRLAMPLPSAPPANCGADLDCLADAAGDRRSAQAAYQTRRTLEPLSVALGLVQHVGQTADGQSVLVTETRDATIDLSAASKAALAEQGRAAPEIDALAKAVLAAAPLQPGQTEWCLFPDAADLADALRSWQRGFWPTTAFDRAACCVLAPDGTVDAPHCDGDFPVAGACPLTVFASSSLTIGDVPDDRAARYAGEAGDVTWTSSNPAVVSLSDASGEATTLRARSAGTSRITVTDTAAEDCSRTYTVTVTR
jgi:hypothetical protein